MASPQNLLFVFADQMHRYALGCMGTADIATPNLDRLAEQGVLFRQAYANCPVCTPFRVNLFTGQYTCTTGAYSNAAALPDDRLLLAQALGQAGLRTSYVGKWHLGGAGNGPIPKELRGGFDDFIGYQCYNGFYEDVCFYDEEGEEYCFDQHRTDVTTDLAIDRLQNLQGEPFAMFVSYQAPHYPVQPAPQYAEMYAGKTIQRRPNCQDVEPYTPTFSPRSPRPFDECPDYQRYGGDLDEYLRLYYAMVTQVDANVGRLLAALEAYGMGDDTAVIFTADHGDMQGSHGLVNKCLPHEESAGIPLIVRVPGGAGGIVSDALVSCVDFYPTCVELAGGKSPDDLPGRSLAPLLQHGEQELQDPVFAERPDWRMIRHGDHKLVVDAETFAPTMLFDLAEDPCERHNRVQDEACHDQLTALHDRLVQWYETWAR